MSMVSPTRLTAIAWLFVLGSACSNPASDKAGEPTSPAWFAGKVDSSQVDFVLAGALYLGRPDPTGELSEQTRTLGYTFYARKGEQLDLVVDGGGGLDTVMYVFGPHRAGTWGAKPIAADDDGGPGLLSRIAGLVTPEDGRYLVMLTGYDSMVRGRFSLGLRCESGCERVALSRDFQFSEIHPAPDPEQGDANGDGAVDPDGDEFVEIRNMARVPLSLAGAELLRVTESGEQSLHRFDDPLPVWPGQAVVVFSRLAANTSGKGARLLAATREEGLDLGDTRDTLVLRLGPDTILDTARYEFQSTPRGSILQTLISESSSDSVGDEDRPHCVKGKPCGNSCINRQYTCHVEETTYRQEWVGHLDVTAGGLPFSPGFAADGSPFPSPESVDSHTVLVEADRLTEQALLADIHDALLARFGQDITVSVSDYSRPADEVVLAGLKGFLAVLSDMQAGAPGSSFAALIFTDYDSRTSTYGDQVYLHLDLRDDPRSHLALLSARPESEPLLQAFRAEVQQRFSEDFPLISQLEPMVPLLIADPESDLTALFEAIDGAGLVSRTSQTITWGDNNEKKRIETTVKLTSVRPDEFLLTTYFKDGSDEINSHVVEYRYKTDDSFWPTPIRKVFFEASGAPQIVRNYHRDATGKLLRRTWQDGLGNVQRIVQVNPEPVPRDAIPEARELPADGCFAGLHQILGEVAPVTIGVFDSGVDYNHPELARKLHLNTLEGEIFDASDSDANGYVDDFLGWDFDDQDALPYDYNDYLLNFFETFDHGTHVAGIATAGTDVLQILPVRFKTMPQEMLDAVNYMAERGAAVVNMSFGGSFKYSYETLDQAMAAHPNMLFVTAAGNDGKLLNDTDQAQWPACFKQANLISVAAVDANNELTSWSNYGEAFVDLAAPGDGIYNTVEGGGYGIKSGTSMASPFVVNTAAKVLALDPELTPSQVRRLLFETVDERADLAGKVAAGGVVNPERAQRTAFVLARVRQGALPDEASAELPGALPEAELERIARIASRIATGVQ